MRRPILGQGKPQKKTARLGALGGKIGEVHPQPLAGNRARRIFRKKMHSSDQNIICDDDIVSWLLGDDGCIVAQAKGARPSKRREVGRNQFVFGRTRHSRSRCSRTPRHRANEAFRRRRRVRGADFQDLRDQCRIIRNPVPHNDPASGPGHAHHLLGHVKRLWREHGSKDAHDEIKSMIFQLVQIGRIAFLKLAIRETLLLWHACSRPRQGSSRYRRPTRPLQVSPPATPSFHRRIRDPEP